MNIGKIIIIIGVILILIGTLILFKDKLPFLRYIGRLPGDIYIKKDNFTFYFPLTTGIIASVVFSVIFIIIKKLK